MNKTEALEFLKEHCPLSEPDDTPQEAIDKYHDVIEYFSESLDKDLIRPVMLSFGPGNGFGLYQTVVFALQKFNEQDLKEPLIESLKHPSPHIRYWACQHAMDIPIPETAPYLRKQLEDDNDDIAFSAAAALEDIGEAHDYELIKTRSLRAKDEEGKELFEDILNNIENNKRNQGIG